MTGGYLKVLQILVCCLCGIWTLSRRCHWIELDFSDLVDTAFFPRNITLFRLKYLCDFHNLLNEAKKFLVMKLHYPYNTKHLSHVNYPWSIRLFRFILLVDHAFCLSFI